MSAPKILELDFGMGNIRSLEKALEHLGAEVNVTGDPDAFKDADAVVIPGDGAFGQAMEELTSRGLPEALQTFLKTGKPVFGVCIGFQLFFSHSNEFGDHNGLGFFEGDISRFPTGDKKVPHMGWSPTKLVENSAQSRLFKDIPDNTWFYYIHSYRLPGKHAQAMATVDYMGEFTTAVEHDNLFAVQFHPEKSHKWGLKLLENFIALI